MTGGREVQPSPLVGEGGARYCRAPGEGGTPRLSLLSRARELRHNMTDAEHAVWRILRNRQFSGVQFRRQVSIGPYIADFVCYDARLVIEADGGQHNELQADRVRDAWFAGQGFRVLRFWNNEIHDNPEGVATIIALALKGEAPLTRPLCGHPLPQGERVDTTHPAGSWPPSPAREEGLKLDES